jgi:hypothetical protein
MADAIAVSAVTGGFELMLYSLQRSETAAFVAAVAAVLAALQARDL